MTADRVTHRLALQLTAAADARTPLTVDARDSVVAGFAGITGAAVRGAADPRVVAHLAAETGDDPLRPVPVVGSHRSLGACAAARTVGLAAVLGSPGEHRDAVAPWAAAVVVGLLERRTGEDVVLAYVVGAEVERRLVRLLDGSPRAGDARSAAGVVAAAVAVGLLLRQDADALTQTIGLAVSQTGGTTAATGAGLAAFHIGNAAANGVLAALLVRHGFTAPTGGLEGRGGFVSTLCPGRDPADVAALAEPIDDRGWRTTVDEGRDDLAGLVRPVLGPRAATFATVVLSVDRRPDLTDLVAAAAPATPQP